MYRIGKVATVDLYEFNPNLQPAAALQSIGVAAQAIAQIESQVRNCIAGFADLDFIAGGIITTHIPFLTCIDVLETLGSAQLAEREARENLKNIIGKIRDAYARRNRLVHRQLATKMNNKSLHFVVQKARGSFTYKTEPTSIEAISMDAAFIYALSIELQQFIMDHDLEPRLPAEG